ncbi:MAG: radical SAM protein [Elusimicrobia bacterium]|nr:radical SAM protein [Elusimicrobiota bacterium]
MIRKFKIAVTSDCSLRCRYCFVDKAAGQTVSLRCADAALRMFLEAPGRLKKLEIYGGEPFLRFARVRRVLDMAARRAARLGKTLSVTVATNGVGVRDRDLDYLRAAGARLSVSFSGSGAAHDRFRRFADGAGSYERIVAKLPRMFAALGSDAVGAIFCVHPQGTATLARDFRRLARLGLRRVNLEVVHGFAWSAAARARFVRQLDAVGAYALDEIRRGRPIVFDTFLDFLDPELKRRGACPFYRDLEMFPGGEFSFYPYPFVPRGRGAEVAVGHALEGFAPPYRDCGCDPAPERCSGCRQRYYRLRRVSEGNEPYRERTRFLARLFKRIIAESRTDRVFLDYIRGLRLAAAGGLN